MHDKFINRIILDKEEINKGSQNITYRCNLNTLLLIYTMKARYIFGSACTAVTVFRVRQTQLGLPNSDDGGSTLIRNIG